MDSSSIAGRFASRKVRITALSAAAVMLAGLGTTFGTAAHAAPAISCSPIKVVAVPGTWETDPGTDPDAAKGMLRGVTDKIQQQFGSKVSSYWVSYESDAFKDGVAYADSEKSGVDATRSAMTQIAKACPDTKIASVGYSQGADVNGDVAADIGAGRGPIPAERYIAGGNLADPQQGTKGAADLGVRQPGTQGLLGPRKGGYGAVSGRMATACLRGDMYCATPNRDHLIRAIGAVGGNVGLTSVLTSGERDLAKGPKKQEVTKPADLNNLPGSARKLAKFAHGGNIKGVTQAAQQLSKLVGPAETVARLASNPALVSALLATPAGSQTRIAGEVLQKVGQSDIGGLGTDARKAIKAASRHDLDTLDSVATDVTKKVAPLAGVPKADVAKATIVMQALQPAALFTQVNNLAGVTKIDYKAMARASKSLTKAVHGGNTKGAVTSLNTLEDQLMPLARIANKVDFRSIGAALALSQDPQTHAVGNALVALDRVNWTRITRDLRTVQNKLAKINPKKLPTINRKHPEKSLNNLFGVNLLGLTGPATDLAQHGLDVAGVKLPNGSVAQLVRSSLKPSEVIRESVDAAQFFGSQVHVKYGEQPVDGSGQPATATLANWLAPRIDAA